MNDFFESYFGEWNLILVIIGGCSLIALTFFIERLFYFKKTEIDAHHFIISLREPIIERNIIEAIGVCEEKKGALSQVIKAGLLKHERPKEEIVSSMELMGLYEIAKLEKNAKILSIIGHITPLIGLLGTVLGFIQAFSEMRKSGLMDISASKIGEAMEYALITTAAGLVVAIPSVVGYNYLVSRIKSMVLEMQRISYEVVDLLVRNNEI